ncbi:hypothetical protein AB1Y20_000878 [Prymnesium parvum]|uniref:Uncharacterized protein n=1 Tax=Prymnesium parvum TaxID=97485 RepID=A0AB34K6Q0_PRYPA
MEDAEYEQQLTKVREQAKLAREAAAVEKQRERNREKKETLLSRLFSRRQAIAPNPLSPSKLVPTAVCSKPYLQATSERRVKEEKEHQRRTLWITEAFRLSVTRLTSRFSRRSSRGTSNSTARKSFEYNRPGPRRSRLLPFKMHRSRTVNVMPSYLQPSMEVDESTQPPIKHPSASLQPAAPA